MNSVVMSNLHGLTLFVWIVSILTSSISDELETDGTTRLLTNKSFNNVSPENNHQALSSDKPVFEPNNSAQIYRRHNDTSSLMMGEGGPISVGYTTQLASSTALYSTSNFDNRNIRNNFSAEKDAVVKVSERNITSKIVPRKGATETLNTEKENIAIEKSIINNINSTVESSTATISYSNDKHTDNNLNHSKLVISDKEKNLLNITANNTLQPNVNTTLQREVTANTTMTTTLFKEHKAKPTVTVGERNNDKRPLISPTRQRLGLPKRIDYVFQVIIALIALPALGAILFIVYKQGRDCWDKRHYRRMDFLIDGMYND
ncbi:uncharacterized protein LOC116434348 [Nomia melanderi]|uniref:uncharacterized protein LOC116434348 n=1 Tax=Nomia melanderi TaxID=2448451 RepID=UPI0013044CC0|nr:uncharacterized protein LOC116434348 [Nomia melanderi]